MYPKGDTWGGGGLWTSATTFWLDDDKRIYEPLRESAEVSIDGGYNPATIGNGAGFGAYYPRLVRGGWTHVEKFERRRLGCWASLFTLLRSRPAVFEPFDAFEKPVEGGWTVRKVVGYHPRRGDMDVHQLVRGAVVLDQPDWQWVELDGERLVWATDGKLFAGSLGDEGVRDVRELYDFNAMRFERIKAPY